LISQWDEEDITHCKDLEQMNKEQAHNISAAIDVVRGSFFTYFIKFLFQNCPLLCSSPKQAGGYFPQFFSPAAPVLSPIYSHKLEYNEIKPTSNIKGKSNCDSWKYITTVPNRKENCGYDTLTTKGCCLQKKAEFF